MTDHKTRIAEARNCAEAHAKKGELRTATLLHHLADMVEAFLQDRHIGLTDVRLYDAGYEDGLRKAQEKA